ncbi:MAG: hypothetical protein AAGG51_20005 [Cyanobacteria bacterium P01_G01_bin.54]
MVDQQYIPCPDCDSQIPFDPYVMLSGEQFSCPECPSVSIGIAPESREIVRNSLDELENLKKQLANMKPEQPSS